MSGAIQPVTREDGEVTVVRGMPGLRADKGGLFHPLLFRVAGVRAHLVDSRPAITARLGMIFLDQFSVKFRDGSAYRIGSGNMTAAAHRG